MSLSKEELETLEALYARRRSDEYLPPQVAERTRQIRELIAEVQTWRESAGEETGR